MDSKELWSELGSFETNLIKITLICKLTNSLISISTTYNSSQLKVIVSTVYIENISSNCTFVYFYIEPRFAWGLSSVDLEPETTNLFFLILKNNDSMTFNILYIYVLFACFNSCQNNNLTQDDAW